MYIYIHGSKNKRRLDAYDNNNANFQNDSKYHTNAKCEMRRRRYIYISTTCTKIFGHLVYIHSKHVVRINPINEWRLATSNTLAPEIYFSLLYEGNPIKKYYVKLHIYIYINIKFKYIYIFIIIFL